MTVSIEIAKRVYYSLWDFFLASEVVQYLRHHLQNGEKRTTNRNNPYIIRCL